MEAFSWLCYKPAGGWWLVVLAPPSVHYGVLQAVGHGETQNLLNDGILIVFTACIIYKFQKKMWYKFQ